jgi:hypothetical protein
LLRLLLLDRPVDGDVDRVLVALDVLVEPVSTLDELVSLSP